MPGADTHHFRVAGVAGVAGFRRALTARENMCFAGKHMFLKVGRAVAKPAIPALPANQD
jgi:hypothetical protein